MKPEPTPPPLLGHLDPAAARVVEELLTGAAHRIRTRLVNRSGTDMPVRALGVEWMPLGQAIDRPARGSAFATFRLDPSGLLGIVSIDGGLLTKLVGLVLGQPTDVTQQPQRFERPPSRFDLVIARRIGEDVVNGLAEIMPPEVATEARIGDVGTSAHISLGIPRTALVGLATYEFGSVDDPSGRITVLLPSEINRLAAPRAPRRTTEARVGMERVMPLPVTAVAELGRVNITLSQLRGIKPGQILDLGPQRDVVIRVGDRPALLGEAGVQNTVRSVRVKARAETR